MAERIASARSVLFVPGDRPDRFAKALASGADIAVLDLEDAVAVGDKDAARVAVGDFLSTGVQVLVRVNGTDTSWCADDLQMLAQWKCAVMVPKAHSASQLQSIAEQLAPGTPLVVLIETAAGVNATEAICAVDTVVRAAFGSIDLGAELGVDPDVHQALQYARSAVVLGSAAAGRAAPLDGVTTELGDMGMLADDISHAVRLGFGGKLCIHPRQVAVVNQRFSPSTEELAWARKVIDEAAGGEVRVVDGKMVDKPVLARAERILLRAGMIAQPTAQ
ncbi:HpcH/HpaI aldolase/citrate lyase family protein [Mycolicibacterium fluoranthenivorans]|uniref:HpcH/HpaI aldolase/citrate lyase family protein n=1 Tax=Mycolicibacterium fluoranthenivorans TaxID=258505 RepID=UPI000B87C5B3|nr:CoA ester lyase [Mycolicibacterium fluoranthenivorans]